MLMADTKKTAEISIQGSKGKQELAINCKTEGIVASKRNSWRCKLQIRYFRIKLVQKLNLGSFIRDKGKSGRNLKVY